MRKFAGREGNVMPVMFGGEVEEGGRRALEMERAVNRKK